MINRLFLLAFALIAISKFVDCNKSSPNFISNNKVSYIHFSAPNDGLGIAETSWVYDNTIFYPFVFCKSDYPNAKYISFEADIESESKTNTSYAELYNIKDSSEIHGSLLICNDTFLGIYDSRNIFDSLPNTQIEIAVRIKSSQFLKNTTVINPCLILH
jgi:hypothetical protein